jgi:hypothetical protein
MIPTVEGEDQSGNASGTRSLAGVTSRAAIEQAIAEFDELGRESFLRKYGFGASRSYFLLINGKRYDSKAILGASHGFEHPNLGPLTSDEFSGGESTVRRKLESLGFEVIVDELDEGWTRDRFLHALGSLSVSTVAGSRSPHKPLLALMALARWKDAGATQLSFREVAEPLGRAIKSLLPPDVSAVDPSQPFWRLQKDEIWEVSLDGQLSSPTESQPSTQELERAGTTGGFRQPIYRLLETDEDLVWDAAGHLATTYFPNRERDALSAVGFPNRPARVWWVNQGQSFGPERAGGYLWAPASQKNGVPAQHHVNVSKLMTGDIVLSYSKKLIRSISVVTSPPESRRRPSELPEVVGTGDGYYCELQYLDLDEPIELNEIADRSPSDGPFNSTGGVLQGYLYQLSDQFASRLKSTFADRWPDGSPFHIDPWEQFVYWARRIIESPEFRAAEPEWKRSISDEIAAARDAMLGGNDDWPTSLLRSFRKANLVDYRSVLGFSEWVEADPGSARSALTALWDQGQEQESRIDTFLAALPRERVSSPGARAAITSFLLMGSDPSRFVIYRPTPFDTAYRLTHYTVPPAETERDRLTSAWGFLDAFIAEAHDRGVVIEDRIDAQSLVWAIAKHDPPASWSRSDQRAFLEYRSDHTVSVGRALAVYVGQASRANLEFGLAAGRWGWKRTTADYDLVEPGDLLVLASGFTGGNVRTEPETFATGGFTRVDIGRITSQITEDADPFWPDEVADEEVKYGYRLRFELLESIETISVTNVDAHLGGDVGEAVRKSAIGGNGVLVEIEREPVNTPTTTDLARTVEAFAAACRDANLDYGQRHLPLVRTFITSLATKRFVILTGLSGSGKTRLALALGQWFGNDYSAVIPVRPDWTSPDALFGYENGLSPEVDGNHAWHVPGALEFMLRAAGDPRHPYLLILDEMNLAHVERYFADVLSGIESGEPILPNLRRNESGEWRPVGGRLELPSNLFVVGTVNVDETTYMFSPKVLDRANTIEFRVQTEDLAGVPESVEAVAAGSDSDVASFLAVASERPDLASAVAEVGDDLRDLHRLLAKDGREFGHRTFYEALRFTALHQLAGDDDPRAALDLQVLQKVLPKFHGSVREIKEPLAAVAAWAFFGPGTSGRDGFDPLSPPADTEPALPRTFEKSARMLRRLRDNHFVSFTE